MIASGSLKDKVTFQSAVRQRSSTFGTQLQNTWSNYATRWARVTYARGARALNVGEVWLTNSISILVRYDASINDRMRIVWNGQSYKIDSLNRSKQDGSMTIVATKIDNGTEPQG